MLENTQNSSPHETGISSLINTEGRSPILLWIIWVVWTPLIIPAIITLLQTHLPLPSLLAALAALILFFGIYFWATWRRAHILVAMPTSSGRTDALTWATVALLLVLSAIFALLGPGPRSSGLFYFAAGYIGESLPVRRAIPVAIIITLLAMGIGWYTGMGWLDLVQTGVFVSAIIFIIRSMLWSVTTSWELHSARKEIARLAVETERLRIARDLHDVLGHNLSLIALKSELAGRLVKVAPERAATEIGDVENVARTTLQDVREAVASYRQPSLTNELHASQEILAAAGIVYHFEGDQNIITTLPSAIEAVLAWVVREGVTNVIRHSRAHLCTIRISREKNTAHVEISDDGTGLVSGTASSGNGLRGLAERVVALGGQYASGNVSSGGFHISVTVPLTLRNPRSELTEGSASPGIQMIAKPDIST